MQHRQIKISIPIRLATLAAASFAAVVVHAQDARDQLAMPSADAQHFTVLSPGGTHGKAAIWIQSDGTRMVRESVLLRGQVWELEEASQLGPDKLPAHVRVHGTSPRGKVDETFAVLNGRATWKGAIDSGSASYARSAFYLTAQGPRAGDEPLLLETLLSMPTHSLSLLPAGNAAAVRLTEVSVGEASKRKMVVGWAISGLENEPLPIWATEDGKFFGSIGAIAVLPVGYERSLEVLQKAQDEALARRSSALVKQLLKDPPSGPIVFSNVRAFVDGDHFVEGQTVVVDHGHIVRVGPADSVPKPPHSRIIDGSGKTLIPGLWDSHQHIHDDASGPYLLSLGITSARDCGNTVSLTLARAERRAKGDLLIPLVYPSVLLDGKGPYSSQSGVIVTSLDEALAATRKAKQDHFTGVKIYGSFDPSWVAPVAAEARRLGLHVHGHLPAGMRPSQAIDSGYNEITHIYFVMMEAMPDHIVMTSNGINRIAGTGRYAKDVDLNANPIRSLIANMAKRGIAADPTLVVAESVYVPEQGELAPAYAPFVGTVPPATERSFRQGGFTVPTDLTREDFRKSFAKLSELVEKMHKAGVRIVAGTDGSGIELVRELELYVVAGFTSSEALAAATIEPARLLGVDKTTGSIEVGKVADLVLVDGDPSHRIGDLRNTRWVMMGGRLMDADALRAASGFLGRPK